ncbi:CPBP family intramembrane metalloprotease [Clostridium autoethanogenum]|uniref:CPBP family intramembrane metalloprotease n=1 Tax=Clostridium autoethanogenum TaxID=84023 RepID=A0A3M0SSY1_9CLOT|nr:CPBP family intramembrane glutamic endopeptidase [Clostridium autoethanogenum]RMD01470.1 CPBP family intramembrane metalloprotease [Clostridium autoethanogenum]
MIKKETFEVEKITSRRLMIFGGLTIVSLCFISILYWNIRNKNLLTLLMISPMVSVLLTRIITKEGKAELYLNPNFKGNVKWYIAAYFLTPVVAYIGALLYFIIFSYDFNPLGSLCALEYKASSLAGYYKLLFKMIPVAVAINPIMCLAQCFGEEFAWRGYLLPKLRKVFSPWKATLLTGVIWGMWHSPIIVTGYNYGTEHPVFGVIAMIIFTTVIGIIAAYLFFKTKSVWVAAVFHASMNSIDLFPPSSLFMSKEENPFIGPNITGVIGDIGFVVLAIICFTRIYKNKLEV